MKSVSPSVSQSLSYLFCIEQLTGLMMGIEVKS
jgi:hypothetical protein